MCPTEPFALLWPHQQGTLLAVLHQQVTSSLHVRDPALLLYFSSFCAFQRRRVVRDICECPTWHNSINKSTMSRPEERPAVSLSLSLLSATMTSTAGKCV